MTFKWLYRGRVHASRVVGACPMCGAAAVVRLPAIIRAEQPDSTTHVCHPLAGGCNHGFEKETTELASTAGVK